MDIYTVHLELVCMYVGEVMVPVLLTRFLQLSIFSFRLPLVHILHNYLYPIDCIPHMSLIIVG